VTQPVGLATWNPSTESVVLIGQVALILDEYADYLPLTGRQIFYRLVGAYGYEKTERAYKRLLDKLNRARRAGLVPFEHIRDDGVTHKYGLTWDSARDFARWLPGYVERSYRQDRQHGQETVLELWVEAAGMVPQAFNVSWPYGVEVYSSGGFNSTTMKYEAARRIVDRYYETGQPTKVLHVGDHDPSGVAIYDNLRDDIPAMVIGIVGREHGDAIRNAAANGGISTRELLAKMYAHISQWRRIAVTTDQMADYRLEEAPPKATDSRSKGWVGGTVQVEAMSPDQLADEIDDAIQDEMDSAHRGEVVEDERVERDKLLTWIEEAGL